MHCMKCGREIDEGRAFCPECLAAMDNYPVKPGTVVQIPTRKDTPRNSAPRKKPLTPEEQNLRLRKVIRFLLGAWLVTLLIAAVLAYPAYKYMIEENHFLPGQNYSVVGEALAPED